MKASQKAMIYKDIKEITGDKQVLLPMLIVPLIMMMVLPAGLMIGARYGVTGINGMDLMMKRFSNLLHYENQSQFIVELGVNYMFPILFLLIPIMTSCIIGASSFVVEKEKKTIETLLYTPMTIKDLFISKVLGTLVPAYAVALISALFFGIIVNTGGLFYFGKLIFPNIKWIILIIWVAPAATLLGISFMVLISAKVHTFQEAQQMSVFIVLPVIMLLIGQMTGLLLLNSVVMIILGAALYIIDLILIRSAVNRFTPEKLL
ncbi:MAG: transporter permease protein [Clostridiaceae bacterium]|jgi:ABC-type multidrug transport system permease subunit|nr:transporter permease protein [Clostridiaceae bacterium]